MINDVRVLIVEDRPDVCDAYVKSIRRKGFIVDSAANESEAIQKIKNRTYHVAIVDLDLVGGQDIDGRQGWRILDELAVLNEGTVGWVLSAQDNREDVAKSLRKHKAMDYTDKKSLVAPGGLDKLIQIVREAHANSKLNYWGEKENALDFIFSKDGADIGIDPLLRALKPKDMYLGLKKFIDQFLTPFAPLLPPNNTDSYLNIVSNAPLAHGQFWSKALGKPIEIYITTVEYGKSGINSILSKKLAQLEFYSQIEANDLLGLIYLSNMTRVDFVATN